ncbi:MAG TPA: imidazole glycerol phosphate synthase subunit HisH [Solirubrobacterales bacterium]|nr:imidazole glycerol phosphate synthase subunit HisH [Solirubrobacterales bacterium]
MAEPAAGAEQAAGTERAAGPRLAILDYGMGNLRSVEKAFERVGAPAAITSDPAVVEAADGLILPGVGAFPRAMERIRELGWDELVPARSAAGLPVLGICLGYQLLFESSEEQGGADGLGLLAGTVRTLSAPGLKVPHIGWEPVHWQRESPLLKGIASGEAFYFVHSLTPEPTADEVLGLADFGAPFAAAAEAGRVYGVQFHPEKSSAAGLRLLANFARICGLHCRGARDGAHVDGGGAS